jgi:hypothetical protein
MALWHKGKKVSTGFGKRLRSGEVIKLELNRDAGTLSIWQDGTALGVAFNDLPTGVPLYPAISLFNQVCACCCRMVSRRRSVFERGAPRFLTSFAGAWPWCLPLSQCRAHLFAHALCRMSIHYYRLHASDVCG